MAQYVYDIEGQPLNTNPVGNGWTMRSVTETQGFVVSAIETIANPRGAKAWRMTSDGVGGSNYRLAVWAAGPTDAATVEVLSLQRRSTTEVGMGNLQRFTASGSIDGYFLGLRNNATEARGRSYAAGAISNMGAAAHGLDTSDAWVWMRSQSVGSTHRVRVWLNGTPEPTTWVVEETNATIATGAVGIGDFFYTPHTVTMAWFSVGTNGDPAPDSPLDSFRFRHHPRLFKVIPTLSSPTVTDIGAVCVRPRVTKGF